MSQRNVERICNNEETNQIGWYDIAKHGKHGQDTNKSNEAILKQARIKAATWERNTSRKILVRER